MKIIKLGKYVFHFVVSIYNMVSNVVQCNGQYGVIFCIYILHCCRRGERAGPCTVKR